MKIKNNWKKETNLREELDKLTLRLFDEFCFDNYFGKELPFATMKKPKIKRRLPPIKIWKLKGLCLKT